LYYGISYDAEKPMKINRNLNIVIPIDTDDGKIFVHSVPVSRDVFETFYSELGKVFTQCFDSLNQAHLALTAPQLAYPALKKISNDAGTWDSVKKGLINEIIRLTNIAMPGDNGWESIPLDLAMKRELLDEDTESEVLSSLVFFTSIWRTAPKELREAFLGMASSLRNWELTSSDFTIYLAGLPILTKKENTGKKVKQSSITS
jgi:hypothetical protein